ncbi:unnamed protein product [Meganyctiphanes norvegica]|uniref:Tetraspanin n=1 Tax=Meganyctiphanes norvegica TaxID=48144 RepID=A0AAV2RAR2_MEGNR
MMKESIVTAILLTSNVVLWISGLVVLAIGSHLMADNSAYFYSHVLLGHHPPHEYHPENTAWGNSVPLGTPTNYNSVSKPDIYSYNDDSSRRDKRELQHLPDLEQDNEGIIRTSQLWAGGSLTVVGGMVLLAGLSGCFAILHNDKHLIKITGSIMCAAALCELIVGSWCLLGHDLPAYDSQIHHNVTQRLKEMYGLSSQLQFTHVLDSLQQQLSCCGFWGRSDYIGSGWQRANSFLSIPYSCCILDNEVSLRVPLDTKGCTQGLPSAGFTKGCLVPLQGWMQWESTISGGVLISMALLKISLSLTSIVLSRKLPDPPTYPERTLATALF